MNFDISKVVALIKLVLPYLKAVAAVLGAAIQTLVCLVDGEVSGGDLTAIGVAWSTAYAVWRVSNTPEAYKP